MARSDLSATILEWSKDIPRYCADTLPDFKFTSQQLKAASAFQELIWAKLSVNAYLSSSGKTIEGKPAADLDERVKQLSRKFGMSIMSGVGTGKGALASMLIIWFLSVFPFPKVVCVSPSARQLRDNLWAELAKWHQKSKLKDWFEWQTDRFFLKECEAKQWFASARTANPRNSSDEQAETLAGIHEDFVLIVADEASGVPDPVYRPLESTLTRKCNLALLTFNPTRGKGYAYDTHFKERNDWVTFRWDAEECELVSRESIQRLENKYGRDSNSFRIRVRGLPPLSGDNEVIPWDWIQDAIDREVEPLPDDKLMYSLDVGAGGDDSVLLKRHGPTVLNPIEARGYNESTKVVEWVVRDALRDEPSIFFIDNIGWGWGVAGDIRQRLKDHNIDVVNVNVSEKAFDEDRFYRLRDELWWRARDEFEQGVISIPNDPILCGDLNAPMYDDSSGLIKVESKQDMKRRGVESPNRADALIQTKYWGLDYIRKAYSGSKSSKIKKRQGSWRTV